MTVAAFANIADLTPNGQIVETAPVSATDELLALARQYLTTWQPRLHLSDWEIWVEIGEVAHAHWAAQSDTEWRMHRAHITFPSNFIAKTREFGECLPGETDAQLVEDTVVHELLHILEEPLGSRVNDEIGWWVGSSENSGVMGAELRNSWRDYREWWMNHVVRALVEAYAGH